MQNNNNYNYLKINSTEFNNHVRLALKQVIIDEIKTSSNPESKLLEILDNKTYSKNYRQVANSLLGEIKRGTKN